MMEKLRLTATLALNPPVHAAVILSCLLLWVIIPLITSNNTPLAPRRQSLLPCSCWPSGAVVMP